jgi:membrane protease YdiL (CAAX protease family)
MNNDDDQRPRKDANNAAGAGANRDTGSPENLADHELPAGVLPQGMTIRDIGDISTPGEGVPPSTERSMLRSVFFNSVELRAGWRFLIFVAILACLVIALNVIGHHFGAGKNQGPTKELTVPLLLIFDGITFGFVLLASFIMSRIEKRKLGAYGLPLRRGTVRNFAIGAVWGFGALTVLLAVFWMAHGYQIGSVALHGRQLLYYPLLWAVAFLLVGLSEEYTFRGYGQFTLTTGIGFWPAAILFSLLFGWVHHTNPGEQFIGLVQVVIIALFFCFTLYRTGTLWFAVGYHAAWDWGQTFFYGTPDSGMLGRGHLLNPTFHGPTWLTGGSVGPEGSYLNIPLVLLVALVFHFAFRERIPYPEPGAVKTSSSDQAAVRAGLIP